MTLIKCPYCQKTWINDDDTVCEDCKPKFACDLALADIANAVQVLSSNWQTMIGGRTLLLEDLNQQLESLVQTLKKQ